ncbi:hypothetical protein K443DRAFT_638217 [Laccaria amethystina LaAM-08-1]|uniref:RecQ-mediated genome instability protein 1 n=1 Tax=Laccaria amethystina LaAM-08-1 TaxID=1095629 RepID=A0A0C9WK17_9AGAR|nr:hypothetical protein K443DRAFT_638217 [Laccaria amethystina LaAM-08-1]
MLKFGSCETSSEQLDPGSAAGMTFTPNNPKISFRWAVHAGVWPGLPVNVNGPNTICTTLTVPPVPVDIIRMDDVSTSAFQLDQIRQEREIRAGVGNEEGEEDRDIDVDGEGPMPQYPTGKLRLQLSDSQTVLEASGYRRIGELKLTTPSGFKMQLKNVRIQRGMAFLEPTAVNRKGGETEELVKNQEFTFVNSLRHHMGQVYS